MNKGEKDQARSTEEEDQFASSKKKVKSNEEHESNVKMMVDGPLAMRSESVIEKSVADSEKEKMQTDEVQELEKTISKNVSMVEESNLRINQEKSSGINNDNQMQAENVSKINGVGEIHNSNQSYRDRLIGTNGINILGDYSDEELREEDFSEFEDETKKQRVGAQGRNKEKMPRDKNGKAKKLGVNSKGEGSRYAILNEEGIGWKEWRKIKKAKKKEDVVMQNVEQEEEDNMIMDMINPLFVNQVIEKVVKDKETRQVWKAVVPKPVHKQKDNNTIVEGVLTGKEGDKQKLGNENKGVESVVQEDLSDRENALSRIIKCDFNAYLKSDEKRGGAKPNWSSMKNFHNCVDYCCLIDMGFLGYPYAWSKGKVEERIDRFLCNFHWQIMFKDASIFHLFNGKSDHKSIKIEMFPKRCGRKEDIDRSDLRLHG
ncbi:RNA-directed DNA polymerase [Senna tora]|uniref:RNA-directed DNA polymerase n=1 Tax=Senna tora TaxID=362788 RepID=A0A834X7V7_9FABA|nr:RNA-directed DNA polymerase [Senna tora]